MQEIHDRLLNVSLLAGSKAHHAYYARAGLSVSGADSRSPSRAVSEKLVNVGIRSVATEPTPDRRSASAARCCRPSTR